MYVKLGAKVQLRPLDPQRDAQAQKAAPNPENFEAYHHQRMERAFFPASDDQEFRFLIMPCPYRWSDKSESQVRLGHYYAEYNDYWSGEFRLVQDPAGTQGAILLLSKETSASPSLMSWVTETALFFCKGPTVEHLTRMKHSSITCVPPVNLQFAHEFTTKKIIVANKLQIALLADLLRAMMYHRELAIVIS